MFIMVIASTLLRYWQELKSILKVVQLMTLLTSKVVYIPFLYFRILINLKVRVLRHLGSVVQAASQGDDPIECEVERSTIIPGDIVLLSSGDLIPADCVVLEANSLLISQSVLTGEVLPVEKAPREDDQEANDQDVINSRNICLAGTSVSCGDGKVLVVNTGDGQSICPLQVPYNV